MTAHRVLTIESSPVFRRVLSVVLGEDPGIETVDSADGIETGLQVLASKDVELILTDIQIGDGDGLEGIRKLREVHPTIPVLVFSAATQPGEEWTAAALAAGAVACVGKPTTAGSLAASMGRVRADLIPKIHEILAGKSKAAPSAPVAPRVLVVDDSRPMRMMIGKLLKEIGAEVVEAENGRHGLERLEQEGPFSVALVDWNMPEMDGLEMVVEVRKNTAHEQMPIMMVTTETEIDKVREAFNRGANAFLTKPFTKAMMLEKLHSVGIIPPT